MKRKQNAISNYYKNTKLQDNKFRKKNLVKSKTKERYRQPVNLIAPAKGLNDVVRKT